jgi:segregation and condensation protein B
LIGVADFDKPILTMKQKDLEMSKNAEAQEERSDRDIDATQVRDTEDFETNGSDAEETKKNSVDSELQNIIEAALFAAKEPLGVRKITALFPDEAQPSKVEIQNVITSLQEQCEFRGIELRRIGIGWRFQSKEKYSPWLRKLGANKSPKYSRALLETLSIIAYRQPVTRGDIEEIRGVGVSSDTIRTLEERDWVAQIGHRDVPGRPALFGTTQGFLEYFNMSSLRDLPELVDKRELGEIAKDMNLTLPMDGVQDGDEAAKAKADSDAKDESQAGSQIDALEEEPVTQQEFESIVEDIPLEQEPLSDDDIESDTDEHKINSNSDNLDESNER